MSNKTTGWTQPISGTVTVSGGGGGGGAITGPLGAQAKAAAVAVGFSNEDVAQLGTLATAAKQDVTHADLAQLHTDLGLLGTQTTLASVLAKLSADPATQTTLAAILARLAQGRLADASSIGVALSTEDVAALASQATLAAILAKIVTAPALDATLSSLVTANHADLAALLAALGGATGGWSTYSNGASAIPIAGQVIKGSGGTFAGMTAVNPTALGAYPQIHNLAAATGYGAGTLIATQTSGTATLTGAPATLTTPTGGLSCFTGIVLVWSTTQYTYTAVATATNVGTLVWFK